MAVLPLLLSISASAQSENILIMTQEEDNMTVSVAGFDIKLGPSSRYRGDARVGSSMGFCSLFDIGMASIVCDGDIPAISIPRSWSYSGDIVTMSLFDNPFRRVKLSTGIKLTHFNYRLRDNYAISINSEGIPEQVGICPYDKSKLKLTYIGVPVSLGVRIGHSLRLTGTATFDMLLDARNKVKSPKSKTKLDNLNPYRTSVEVSVWGHEMGMFINYGLSSIFSEASGLDARTLSIGLKFID